MVTLRRPYAQASISRTHNSECRVEDHRVLPLQIKTVQVVGWVGAAGVVGCGGEGEGGVTVSGVEEESPSAATRTDQRDLR
jgi:hypothetical protein